MMSTDKHAWFAAGLLAILAFATTGRSAGAETTDQQVWQEECGSCHIAYPARLLPAQSWDEIMRTLDEHFGVDASLDAAAAAKVGRYLGSAARPQSQAHTQPPVLRITQTRWFRHEHDEISAARWRNAKVGSPANCSACHRDADAGRFSEKSLHVPQ